MFSIILSLASIDWIAVFLLNLSSGLAPARTAMPSSGFGFSCSSVFLANLTLILFVPSIWPLSEFMALIASCLNLNVTNANPRGCPALGPLRWNSMSNFSMFPYARTSFSS
ncbi:unnamed protein product [Spodoptera exigua]|nr:unnamed protein product [Spodoptera exigua]